MSEAVAEEQRVMCAWVKAGSLPVTSDANGEFTVTGDYQCPSASAQVYLMATGGNPGLPRVRRTRFN
jgi:hypothetical protein